MIKISARELQCLRLLAEGYNAKQTAKTLCIKYKTVLSYVNRMKEKFEANTLGEIIKKACAENIL